MKHRGVSRSNRVVSKPMIRRRGESSIGGLWAENGDHVAGFIFPPVDYIIVRVGADVPVVVARVRVCIERLPAAARTFGAEVDDWHDSPFARILLAADEHEGAMTTDDGKRTLADIGEVSRHLHETADKINSGWQSHNDDAHRFMAPSTAASDASLKGYHDLVVDTLSFTDLLIAAALDHADALIKWGEGASRGESTPVWAPWSVARSLVEVCAAARWLVETPLAPRERARRMLSMSRRDSQSMIRIGQDESVKLAEAEADAKRLGVVLSNVPGHTTLVGNLLHDLTELNVYSLLSAASHGEPWAISVLGYEAEETKSGSGTYLASKKPPAFWVWSALTVATIALVEGSRTVALYRGWGR